MQKIVCTLIGIETWRISHFEHLKGLLLSLGLLVLGQFEVVLNMERFLYKNIFLFECCLVLLYFTLRSIDFTGNTLCNRYAYAAASVRPDKDGCGSCAVSSIFVYNIPKLLCLTEHWHGNSTYCHTTQLHLFRFLALGLN